MANFKYGWNWEADKPSKIHCPQCGFPMIVTPSAANLKEGFMWWCIKCGSQFTHGDPKPIEPKSTEPQPVEQIQDNPEQESSLGYPQTRRLFERKKMSEWLNLMVGDALDTQKVSTIATKIKSHYRFRFGRNPVKTNHHNLYSGIELNACIERLYVIDKPLANELQTLHLEKIRRDVGVGSIIFGDKGIAREVLKIIDGSLVLDFGGQLKRVDRSSVMSIVQLDGEMGF